MAPAGAACRSGSALIATALVGTALFSVTASAASFDLTVTNKSKAARSYQLVQVGQPCNAGTVLENGWIAPGETKTETFRAPNRPLTARLCVELRPETRLRFEPGEDVRTRLVADADDPADVDVEPVPDTPQPNDYDVVGLYVINIGESAEISITPDYPASKCEAGMQSLSFNKPGEHRGSWKFRVDNSGWCALKPTVVVWHVTARGPGWKSEGAIIANNAAPFVFTSHCGLDGGLQCSAAGWGPGLFGTIRIWRRQPSSESRPWATASGRGLLRGRVGRRRRRGARARRPPGRHADRVTRPMRTARAATPRA